MRRQLSSSLGVFGSAGFLSYRICSGEQASRNEKNAFRKLFCQAWPFSRSIRSLDAIC